MKAMMISVAGCLNKVPGHLPALRSGRGYTLLELLIVLVIIATLASVATLSLGGLSDDPADKALRELRFNVELLSNEAIIRSEPLALGFFDQGYAFFHMPEDDEGNVSEEWQLIDKDRMLKVFELKGAFNQQVLSDGEELYLGAKESVTPQIYAMPTGEITPFEYQLTDTETGNIWDAKFDALGRMIKPEEEAGAAGQNNE